MSSRRKTSIIILIGILAAVILAGPPLAFAVKLPTVCNIFHEKKTAKLGACGHQGTFSKDKLDFNEMEFPAGSVSGYDETLAVLNNHLIGPFIPFTVSASLAPLRC